MSVVTEFKTRGKWTLNPCGNLWLNDENRFGHKLLSKMGWRKGKGLGKHEDGIAKNLKVNYKNNTKGVGWNNKMGSGHIDEYNALLSSLNEGHSPQNSFDVSLEKRSKSMKNRLHYQKFIRGKDVSKYSKKDMESIFGHKFDNDDSTAPLIENVCKTDLSYTASENETVSNSDEATPSHVSSMSISDYFAQKMKEKAGKLLSLSDDSEQKKLLKNDILNGSQSESTEFSSETIKKGKRKKKSKKDHPSKKFKYENGFDLKSCIKVSSSDDHIAEQKNVSFNDSISYHTIANRLGENSPNNCELINYDDNTLEDNTSDNQEETDIKPDNILNCSKRKNSMHQVSGGNSKEVSTISENNERDTEPDNTICNDDNSLVEKNCSQQLTEGNSNEAPTNSETEKTLKHNKSVVSSELQPEPRVSHPISYFNTWKYSQRQALQMSAYKNVLKRIPKHKILSTTNLMTIRGYGNWIASNKESRQVKDIRSQRTCNIELSKASLMETVCKTGLSHASESEILNNCDVNAKLSCVSSMSSSDYSAQNMKEEMGELISSSVCNHKKLLENDILNGTQSESAISSSHTITNEKRKKTSKEKKSENLKISITADQSTDKKNVLFNNCISNCTLENRLEENTLDNCVVKNCDDNKPEDHTSDNLEAKDIKPDDNMHNCCVKNKSIEQLIKGNSKEEFTISETEKTSTTDMSVLSSELQSEPNVSAPLSNYNVWIYNLRKELKMTAFKSALKAIINHKILSTTNLSKIRGYRNWIFNKKAA